MNDTLHNDPVMHALSGARPPADPSDRADSERAHALLDQILATPPAVTTTGNRRGRRRALRVAVAVGTAAAVAAGALLVVNTVAVRDGRVTVQQAAAGADVVAIARASARAITSGRAEMSFDVRRGPSLEQRGVARIEFTGDDRAVTTTFAATNGQPGFVSSNRTVDGAFYLLDGAPGAQRWYRDTNASNPSGGFDLDPRSLLTTLSPAAAFEVVGTAPGANGTLRHLRATRPSAVPTLRLLLGPVPGDSLTSLDLWVGPDNIVQRLAISARRTETAEPACFVTNGNRTCLNPGDRLSRRGDKTIVIPGPGPSTAPRPVTTTGRFDVRFTDVGSPITVTAPAGAIPVAGQG